MVDWPPTFGDQKVTLTSSKTTVCDCDSIQLERDRVYLLQNTNKNGSFKTIFFFSPSMALWGFSGIWDVDALMWSFIINITHETTSWVYLRAGLNCEMQISTTLHIDLIEKNTYTNIIRTHWEWDNLHPCIKHPKHLKHVDSFCFSQHECCLGTWSSSRKALFHVSKSRHLNMSWILFILAVCNHSRMWNDSLRQFFKSSWCSW